MASHPHRSSHKGKSTKRKAQSKQMKKFSKSGTGRSKSPLN